MSRPLLKTFHGRKLLFVMATVQEYGPALRGCFSPLITGVGPVEAALSVSSYLAQMQDLPDLVISLGSAGSRTLKQTEVYQIRSVAYRDMDASALGFEKGVTPFLDQPACLPLPIEIDGLETATLSTGANIVSGNAYQNISQDMVDMESYAVARVCQEFDLPLICLRGVSDGREELQEISDWTQYLHVIDQKLAATVELIESQLESGSLKI